MPLEHAPNGLADRVRRLAEFLESADAVRVRIERGGEEFEVVRRSRAVDGAAAETSAAPPEQVPLRLDAIKAEVVGIFRLSRPAPVAGEMLDADRELAYVEALGIRNPIHSLGGGRIVTIAVADGAAVDYGQALFLIDRG